MTANKGKPPQDKAFAAVGVAGVIRKQFIAQNSYLAQFAEEVEPDPAVYRRELHDGRPHTVFPVVMAVEGVLNEALVTADELAKSVPAWNGRPVVLLHPEEMGVPISASAYPDVFERRVGTVFGTGIDGKRLKAELWIDDKRMDHLGASELVASMLNGEIVEVSTGYFSDDVIEESELEGQPYFVRHTNIRPDHLALLPGQVGACSIMDGCGAPRNNAKRGIGVKVKEALATLAKAVGVHTNSCDCEDCKHMNKLESVRKDFKALKLCAHAAFLAAASAALGLEGENAFKANKALESKHLKMLEDMDEGQLDMLGAMIQAYKATDPAAAADPEPEPDPDPEDPEAMKANKAAAAAKAKAKANEPVTLTQGELSTLIANEVRSAIETAVPAQAARAAVVSKLKANAANPFTDAQLASLPVDALEATELALRPADYSAAGGFSAHGAEDEDEPLAIATNASQAKAAEARAKRRAQAH